MFNRYLVIHVFLGSILTFYSIGSAYGQNRPVLRGSGIEMMPQFYADEVVKGAPVAARISTRTVQQLYDGNRIVHEDVTQLYRDSEGRVRRENPGPGGASRHQMVSLSDPTTGNNFTLDIGAKTAFKTPSFPGLVQFGGGAVSVGRVGSGPDIINAEPVVGDSSGETITIGQRVSALPVALSRTLNTTTAVFGGPGARTEVEPLGQNTINGIRVEGTLRTTTYPAGALGNEQPIVVEKRTWIAPELRMMVRSEEEDPRFGTITYEAEILSTAEPDESLFVVPADFKLIEPGTFTLSTVPP